MLAPCSVSVPAPIFVNARLAPVIVPANVSAPALFTVKMAAPPVLVTVPAPVTLATCCANPARSSVPVTDSAVPLGSALAIPSAIVPAVIVVAPP